METDLQQIKLLLWAILGLQIFFAVSNIACRILGCGERTDYSRLFANGKFEKILTLTEDRLRTHPDDIDALYYRAKALVRVGHIESAKAVIRQLAKEDVRMTDACNDWLESLGPSAGSDS